MQTKNTYSPDEADNTVPVSVRMDRQLKHDLEELARADADRPVANFIRMVLRQYVEQAKKKR